jgi:hypothetical protein
MKEERIMITERKERIHSYSTNQSNGKGLGYQAHTYSARLKSQNIIMKRPFKRFRDTSPVRIKYELRPKRKERCPMSNPNKEH